MLRSYQEVVETIEQSRRFGNLPGAEVTARALAVLGHPEKKVPFVHVAGTNGKGSTCIFLSSILQCAGKRVGCFTSPHLICFEERITVNGEQIAKEDVARLGNRLLEADFGVTLTMFDYCVLMAVLYFEEQNCDIAVIETGLGGRLDSTNALGVPQAAVITRIGRDHTQILGNTLEEIAAEKAGILKKDSVFVMQKQTPEVKRVLLAEAAKRQVHSVHETTPTLRRKAAQMPRRMMGEYQNENAAAAMLAASCVLMKELVPMNRMRLMTMGQHQDEILDGFEKMDEICGRGIAQADWPGRMQVLSEKPFLMADGAHNESGAQALAESLGAMFPGERFHFIMGVMADKDYEGMAERLGPLAIDFVTVTPESGRSLQAEELAEKLRAKGFEADSAERLPEVLSALSHTEKTVAFGSLYFVGEVISCYSIHKK